MKIERIYSGRNYLGESPVWCGASQSLYWINCQPDAQLWRWDARSGQTQHWPMPQRIGAVILTAEQGVLVALSDGIYQWDPATNGLTLLVAGPHADAVHLHEGKCDRQGRLWIGSLGKRMMSHRELGGAFFYRLDGRTLTPVIPDISVANGLAWSPDGRVMYCTDTPTGTVWAHDFAPDTGHIANRRSFFSVGPNEGAQDGAAVDSDGCYWVAMFRGACVRRYTPQGKLDREIALPFSRPTMVAFGGANLDQLFITSGCHGLPQAAMDQEPTLGGVFMIEGLAQGLPEPVFKGGAA